jgi:hypothetical protein
MVEQLLENLFIKDRACKELELQKKLILLPPGIDYADAHLHRGTHSDSTMNRLLYREKLARRLKKAQKEKASITAACQKELDLIPDPVLRRAIIHRYYHHESWRKAAARCGISEGALKMRWRRYQKRQSDSGRVGNEQP